MAELPVPKADLKQAIADILESDDLSKVTPPMLRAKLESNLNLNAGSLNEHRDIVSSLMDEYIASNLPQSNMDDLDLYIQQNIDANDEDEADAGGNRNGGQSKRSKPRNKNKTRSAQSKAEMGIMDINYSDPTNSQYFDLLPRYSIMLNQVDVTYGVRGHNKFYAIQILEHKERGLYKFIVKWGRVGTNGQKTEELFDSKTTAIAKFEKKFKDKTKNEFGTRRFIPVKGKYVPVALKGQSDEPEDMDDDSEDEDDDIGDENDEPMEDANGGIAAQPQSALSPGVLNMMKLIFSKQLQNDVAKSFDYDLSSPLGALHSSQVNKGYTILCKINELLVEARSGRQNPQKYASLTNKYYTVIPHSFGGRLPPVINNAKRLHREIELVEALKQMAITNRILKKRKRRKNPIDVHYEALRCHISPLSRNLSEYAQIEQALQGTHAETHNRYSLEVKGIFQVDRANSKFRHLPFREAFGGSPDGNCKLLWHGSRLSNFVGILSQGLRIAPPEAPTTGYMFGKGIYFADCSSKAANYVHATESNPYGMLILCEVALGNLYRVNKAKFMEVPPDGHHSTHGVGKTVPKKGDEHVADVDGYELALGPLVPNDDREVQDNGSLLYNEYIVYDIGQVRIKYVVLCRYDFK